MLVKAKFSGKYTEEQVYLDSMKVCINISKFVYKINRLEDVLY